MRSENSQHGRGERADTWVRPYHGFFTGVEHGFHDGIFPTVAKRRCFDGCFSDIQNAISFFTKSRCFPSLRHFHQIATLL
jgi:hypothetical protein